MARGRTSERKAKARPAFEALEGRQLMDAGAAPTLAEQVSAAAAAAPADVTAGSTAVADASATGAADVTATAAAGAAQSSTPPPTVKLLQYVTPTGVPVTILLSGPGTLYGSTVRPDGALDLVFNGTGPSSQLVASTPHNTPVPLATVRDADVALDNRSGVGVNQIGLFGLKPFDLIDGGTINLTGGVRKFFLNSVGANTDVELRALQNQTTSASTTAASTTTSNNAATTALVTSILQNLLQSNGGSFGGTSLNSSLLGASASASGGGSSSSNSRVTTANPPANGRALTFDQSQGGVQLILTDGGFVPVFTVTGTQSTPPPPGIRIQINRINGNTAGTPTLANPEIYGYDATNGALIRFDAATGAPLQAIPVPSIDPNAAGVSLARNGQEIVALVGQGQLVRAYDATSGAFVGAFSVADLPGFDSIDGIATTDSQTVLVDAKADGPGIARGINVPLSLMTGAAVPTTDAFTPDRQFTLLGGATGVSGFDLAELLGSGLFDTYQPNTPILGILELNTAFNKLAENDRFPLPGNMTAPAAPSNDAVGSIDQLVARVTSVTDGMNVLSLTNRDTGVSAGTLKLNYPTRLAGLSESFRPSIQNAAVFDIQGDVQAFLASEASGMVINDTGTLWLLGLGAVRNSYVLGYPLVHVFTGVRVNTQLVSSALRGGTRGGVKLVPGLRPIGPLFLA